MELPAVVTNRESEALQFNNDEHIVSAVEFFELITTDCGCARGCLVNFMQQFDGSADDAMAYVQTCRQHLSMKPNKVEEVKSIVQCCPQHDGVTRYQLGHRSHGTKTINVCRGAFLQFYKIPVNKLKQAKKEINTGIAAIGEYSDKDAVDIETVKLIEESNDKLLSALDKSSMLLPNSPTALYCIAWMAEYFDLVGDKIPNRDNEIHLESQEKVNIHREYMFDVANLLKEDTACNYSYFLRLWETHFPNVKIRKYNSCQNCIHFVAQIVYIVIATVSCDNRIMSFRLPIHHFGVIGIFCDCNGLNVRNLIKLLTRETNVRT